MRILPGTTIKLYAGVEIDNGEQIAFSSKAKQSAYFASKLKYTANNCTMNKKTGYVRLTVSGAIASQCNYMSFINPDFDNKEVFCRITDYDYVNNECTEVDYYIDFFQTWMFDLRYENMYISRENLSQADWEKLEVNPYDPTVLEMRTPETLSASSNEQKVKYNIKDSDWNAQNFSSLDKNWDGFSLTYDVDSSLDSLEYMDVIFIAPIDWADLDAGSTDVSSDIPVNPLDSVVEYFDKFVDGTTTKKYGAWIEEQTTVFDINVAPSMAWGNFLKYLIQSGNYAYYQTVTNTWHNVIGTGPDLKPNTHMAMPYDVVIMPHSTTGNSYLSTCINVLTSINCVSSIMGIYTLPKSLLRVFFDSSAGIQASGVKNIEVESSKGRMNNGAMPTVKSHKLLNFPYSYLTLMDCDGNEKEYHYEQMYNTNDVTKVNNFKYMLDLNVQPALIAGPFDTSISAGGNVLLDNSIVMEAIPQTPYMTDSYLTAQASAAANAIGVNTSDYQNELRIQQTAIMGKYLDAISGGVRDTAKGTFATEKNGGDYGKALNAGLSAMSAEQKLRETMGADKALTNRISNLIGAYEQLGAVDNVFNGFANTRPAYAGNIYHAGSRNGLMHYNNGMNPIDIYVLHRRLNDEILKQYDLYFQQYGYTSNRCGIPRVCNFIAGVTGDENVPHWETINNKQVTYVQVSDCKVIHAMLPVSQYIQALFQNGCRFINGDNLGGN